MGHQRRICIFFAPANYRSFDCVAVRFTHADFAQDDSLKKSSPILMLLKPTSSFHRARVEEVSEALHRRTGSGLRSARDLE